MTRTSTGNSIALEPDANDATPLTGNKGIARIGIGKYAEEHENED